jgi:hypothetical protein
MTGSASYVDHTSESLSFSYNELDQPTEMSGSASESYGSYLRGSGNDIGTATDESGDASAPVTFEGGVTLPGDFSASVPELAGPVTFIGSASPQSPSSNIGTTTDQDGDTSSPSAETTSRHLEGVAQSAETVGRMLEVNPASAGCSVVARPICPRRNW